MFTKPRLLHRRGTRAAQPAANGFGIGEGTLYYVTDEDVLERSNGTIWQSYAAAPAVGGITQLTGDVTAGPGSGSQVATLANSGVAAGSYGSATQVAAFTVDAKGRLTAAANTSITGLLSGLTSPRIPFASGASALTDDAALNWDNTNKRIGIGVTPSFGLDLLAAGVDIGYVARFRDNGNAGSSWVLISSPAGANAQAGFSLFQTTNSTEWRFAALGTNGEGVWRVNGNGLDVFMCSLNGNVIINNAITDPTTGSKCLIFGDGTVPSGLDANTAGLYANADTDGVVNMFAINEAGQSVQLTGPKYTVTATGNIDDLDFRGASVIIMNNTSDATIRGLLAGYDGQVVTIVSRNTGNVFTAHQNTNSSAANRLINWVTSGDTPLVFARGAATYVYDATSQRWRLTHHSMGGFITPTFNAGDFTGNGAMTWTVASGDVTVDTYTIVGRAMLYCFRFLQTTVGGTPNTTLIRSMPGGYTLAEAFDGIAYGEDNSTKTTVWMFNNSTTGIGFAKLAGGNWAAATDATRVSGYLIMSLT